MPKSDPWGELEPVDAGRLYNAVRLGKQSMIPRRLQARHERIYGHVLTFGCCAARPVRMVRYEPFEESP